MNKPQLHIWQPGLCDYERTWRKMQHYTNQRTTESQDQLWLLQHPPVFTLGLAGKPEHLLAPGNIPVIKTDRGGQVTYHGPGQLMAYLLLDLRKKEFGIKLLVARIERAIINLLKDYKISGCTKAGAPGVYVGEKKIAAIGLRVRHGCTFHGLSLNVDMDLEPFNRINPCGFPGLEVTQLAKLGGATDMKQVEENLSFHLASQLDYTLAP